MMSGWGIADTAPKIEKIKAESADYLHGLDSCGIIEWSTYSDMFDFYEDLIEKAYAQGKEDAQHEIKTDWDTISRHEAIDALRVAYWDDNIQSAKDDPCIVDAMTDWAIRQVKALPPIQPEIKTDGDTISRQAAIDAAHKNYDGILDFRSDGETVAQSFEDILTALPSAQPETYKEKLKEIADALSEKFAYMNTCLNERDIILGYLGVKRPSKTHCNTDCTNIKCESYCYNKRLPSAQPERKTEDFEKGLHDMFDHIWDCEIEHPMFQDTVGELMQAVIQLYGRVAQPKHSYWIESHEHVYMGNGVKEWTNWYCSKCDAPNDKPTDFCPTCGAKMMEDGEG